jgi:predicted DNA-binding transcriptional regulator AlpA
MEKNGKQSRIMKGAEVIRELGFGATAGYRYLKFLEENELLQPVYLDGIKTPRWLRSEFEDFLQNREPKECPQFVVNK